MATANAVHHTQNPIHVTSVERKRRKINKEKSIYRAVAIASVAEITRNRCWHPQMITHHSIFCPIGRCTGQPSLIRFDLAVKLKESNRTNINNEWEQSRTKQIKNGKKRNWVRNSKGQDTAEECLKAWNWNWKCHVINEFRFSVHVFRSDCDSDWWYWLLHNLYSTNRFECILQLQTVAECDWNQFRISTDPEKSMK